MRRCCPLCTLRSAAVIDPTCSVCDGHGYLELGRATGTYDPVTVSTAIHLVLEQTARALDLTTRRGADPKPALDAALARAAKSGLIRPHTAPAPQEDAPAGGSNAPPAAALAQKVTGATPTPTDQAMIRAASYPYQHGDRPGSRGLPLLSSAFHPSSLARVGDPQDFETTTAKQLTERDRARYHARALAYVTTTETPPTPRSPKRRPPQENR